ncbi:uncharacterized protein ARMOST_04495 [Armillaria ostoyae]|uniref:Uncharacterized protein n=1 Tax=Armillaria ostoyae TaxID=47428 RepID=A0A284QXI4_ARMOS|nr:uncharacterized protein ARMOST_04495 [Armillaria ostoyae]
MSPHQVLRPPGLFSHREYFDALVPAFRCVETTQRSLQRSKDLASPNGGVPLPIFDAADITKATRSFETDASFSREPNAELPASDNLSFGDGEESANDDGPFDHGYADWIESLQTSDSPQEAPNIDAGGHSADYEAGYDDGYANAYDDCYDSVAGADHTDVEEVDEGYVSPTSSLDPDE